jgi:transcriptional regulator GlxA family with amidase domain
MTYFPNITYGELTNRSSDDEMLPLIGDTRGRVAIDLVLLDGFDLFDLSTFTEIFDLANLLQNTVFFARRLSTPGCRTVTASNGVAVTTAYDTQDMQWSRNLILLCGEDAARQADTSLLHWLRQQFFTGAMVIASGTACHLLARSGLLDHHRCAAPSTDINSLRRLYPAVDFQDRLFAFDERILTCSGNKTSLDLALAVIHRICGDAICRRLADQLNCERIREGFEQQQSGIEIENRALRRAVEFMQARMEEKITSVEIARHAGITTRQLQRLFRRHVDMTPLEFHAVQRLWHARRLLQSTHLAINEVAAAIGFTSPSHFSRCYRRQFNRRPSDDQPSQVYRMTVEASADHQCI